jgi:uncharacterized membrane protein
MPTHETRIAARNPDGVEVYFQHSTLPSKENVEAYESYHSGAAKIMLDMAAEDQREYWAAKKALDWRRFLLNAMGMTFCFVLCLALIGTGTYLMATDHYVTGSASVIIALLAVLGSLASGGRQK